MCTICPSACLPLLCVGFVWVLCWFCVGFVWVLFGFCVGFLSLVYKCQYCLFNCAISTRFRILLKLQFIVISHSALHTQLLSGLLKLLKRNERNSRQLSWRPRDFSCKYYERQWREASFLMAGIQFQALSPYPKPVHNLASGVLLYLFPPVCSVSLILH